MERKTESDHAAAYGAVAREMWRAAAENGPLRLTVTSNSMQPLLRAGDRVLVEPVEPHALRPGAVIVVQRGGEWITHRLVTVDERGWHTHGDNTHTLDAAVQAHEIVGRVVAVERDGHTLDLQAPRWAARERTIQRVQQVQLRVLTNARRWGGRRSSRITRAAARFINWPFQAVLRWLTRG